MEKLDREGRQPKRVNHQLHYPQGRQSLILLRNSGSQHRTCTLLLSHSRGEGAGVFIYPILSGISRGLLLEGGHSPALLFCGYTGSGTRKKPWERVTVQAGGRRALRTLKGNWWGTLCEWLHSMSLNLPGLGNLL